jgi:cell division protein FtsB
MSHELTNLLPLERRKLHAREYALRLATIAAIALSLLIGIHGVLLAPSYLYLRDQIALRQSQLDTLSQERAASGYEDLAARIKSLSENANILIELQSAPSASESIHSVLVLARGGIALTSFTFAPGNGKDTGRMTLAGTAATRESLRTFDRSLGSLAFVTSTDLPLSVYAKEKEIPFTITLSLAWKP